MASASWASTAHPGVKNVDGRDKPGHDGEGCDTDRATQFADASVLHSREAGPCSSPRPMTDRRQNQGKVTSCHRRALPSAVMPGLVPGIHVLAPGVKNVDGRDKPGHDGGGWVSGRATEFAEANPSAFTRTR